jgi:hypothetical protein
MSGELALAGMQAADRTPELGMTLQSSASWTQGDFWLAGVRGLYR